MAPTKNITSILKTSFSKTTDMTSNQNQKVHRQKPITTFASNRKEQEKPARKDNMDVASKSSLLGKRGASSPKESDGTKTTKDAEVDRSNRFAVLGLEEEEKNNKQATEAPSTTKKASKSSLQNALSKDISPSTSPIAKKGGMHLKTQRKIARTQE